MAGTVLCGVNESAAAANAVDVASELCKRLELRLVLVNVARPFVVEDDSGHNEESVTGTQANAEASCSSSGYAPSGVSEEWSSESRSAIPPRGWPRSRRRNERR